MTRKSYKKYKNSGIEWLGKIPEHWEVKKLKYITNSNPSNIDKKSKEGEKEIFLCNYVDVYKNEYVDSSLHFMKATANADQISKFILKKGDVIATKDSEVRNDIAVPALVIENFNDVVCGYHLTHIKPMKIFGNYLFRYFQSKYLRSYFEISANGITRYGINVDRFNSALILIPTEKEQKLIANFLDKGTSHIDSLIQKKKKQIELLKEKRSTLITQVVTKGLDSNIKMKDSGIEWLGKIPEHWIMKRLRFLATINPIKSEVAHLLPDTEVSFVPMEAIKEYGGISLEYVKTMKDVYEGYTFFRSDDVIIAKITPCFENGKGSIAENLVNGIAFGTTELHVVRPNGELDNEFFFYLTICLPFRQTGIAEMYGAGGQKRIPESFIQNYYVSLPSLEEQKIIINYLDKEISRIDSLIEKIKKSIELLKEYRSVLITSAVTGKIDVRESREKPINIVQFQKSKKEITPLFKKAVLGAEIAAQLKDDSHFGRTKFMKTLYLCEAHLQIPLKGQYKREAAGPLDNSIYKMESIMKRNKWFEVVKINSMYKYKALENSEGYKTYFDKYWGDYKEKLNQLLPFAKKFTTEQSEIVDTIYAVWNDFLIEGKTPSDNEIVDEVKNNWHKSKKRFSDEKLKKAIQWMRDQNLIPQGYGQKTKK